MKTIKISGLYEKAYRAYSNLSLSPEKRAERSVVEFEAQLTEDCEGIPEGERQRYIDGYTSHLFAWLGAMANCYSVMITGGSNFNNARHDKMNNAERARSEEFSEWREKAKRAIAKKIEDSKSEEQKECEQWERLKRGLTQKMEWGSVANFVSMVERIANNGNIGLTERCLQLVRDWNEQHAKPFITDRHKFWTFAEVAKQRTEKMEARSNTDAKEEIINGVKIVRNFEADRLQMFFDGKPDAETISKLKHSAFKWSPSNGCWQRQLTSNAVYAMQRILNK